MDAAFENGIPDTIRFFQIRDRSIIICAFRRKKPAVFKGDAGKTVPDPTHFYAIRKILYCIFRRMSHCQSCLISFCLISGNVFRIRLFLFRFKIGDRQSGPIFKLRFPADPFFKLLSEVSEHAQFLFNPFTGFLCPGKEMNPGKSQMPG